MGYNTFSKSNIRNLFLFNISTHNCRVKNRHLNNWVWRKLMRIHEKTIRCKNVGNWWKWKTLQTVFWLWMANSREMKDECIKKNILLFLERILYCLLLFLGHHHWYCTHKKQWKTHPCPKECTIEKPMERCPVISKWVGLDPKLGKHTWIAMPASTLAIVQHSKIDVLMTD